MKIEYDDFKTLPFMTCCVETKIVDIYSNGTTRELQSDDYITGRNNEKVKNTEEHMYKYLIGHGIEIHFYGVMTVINLIRREL